MKVLLIGASGFLGKHILEHLQKYNYDIVLLKHKSSLSDNPNYIVKEGGIASITADYIDKNSFDIIIHCARPNKWTRFRKYGRLLSAFWAKHLNSNLLLQLKASQSQPKLVFASGSLMYGSSTSVHMESTDIHPTSYAKQYYHGELPFLETIKDKSYPIQMIRLPWLIGDGSWYKWFYQSTIKQNIAVPLFGDGLNNMHFLSVNNAADLLVKYTFKADYFKIYNIYSPYIIKQLDFVEYIAKVYDFPVKNQKMLWSNKLEKSIVEAFTSNIVLGSYFTQILDEYKFDDPRDIVAALR